MELIALGGERGELGGLFGQFCLRRLPVFPGLRERRGRLFPGLLRRGELLARGFKLLAQVVALAAVLPGGHGGLRRRGLGSGEFAERAAGVLQFGLHGGEVLPALVEGGLGLRGALLGGGQGGLQAGGLVELLRGGGLHFIH